MGYSRKDEITRLRQERRQAKASKKRKENVRDKLVRFLIVCEGTKTEPHYFEALINNYIYIAACPQLRYGVKLAYNSAFNKYMANAVII